MNATAPAPLIEVEKLEAWYGRRRVLHGIDFSVNPGEIRVIMGGSGSGKSTLLRHLLGLQRPRSGTVRILGVDLSRASEREMLELFAGHAAQAIARARDDAAQRVLAEASSDLASSLDAAAVLERVGRLTVETFADW